MVQPRKIGLFGLSANPPHYGHVKMAQYAKAALGLDEVWWIVAAQNPLKPIQGMAPFADRLRMCRMIADDYDWLKVSDIEQRQKLNRTYDVLQALRDESPDAHFIWMMGADNLANFHQWYKWQDMADMLPIAVMARPGDMSQALKAPALQYIPLIQNSSQWPQHERGLILLDNPMVEISSTRLRQNLQSGAQDTSRHVLDHIRENNLYGF